MIHAHTGFLRSMFHLSQAPAGPCSRDLTLSALGMPQTDPLQDQGNLLHVEIANVGICDMRLAIVSCGLARYECVQIPIYVSRPQMDGP